MPAYYKYVAPYYAYTAAVYSEYYNYIPAYYRYYSYTYKSFYKASGYVTPWKGWTDFGFTLYLNNQYFYVSVSHGWSFENGTQFFFNHIDTSWATSYFVGGATGRNIYNGRSYLNVRIYDGSTTQYFRSYFHTYAYISWNSDGDPYAEGAAGNAKVEWPEEYTKTLKVYAYTAAKYYYNSVITRAAYYAYTPPVYEYTAAIETNPIHYSYSEV